MCIDMGYYDPILYNESEHVVLGPGAFKGLDRLFFVDKMKQESSAETIKNEGKSVEVTCIKFLAASQDMWFKYLEIEPLEDRKLNLMALENCLCEISKYLRV